MATDVPKLSTSTPQAAIDRTRSRRSSGRKSFTSGAVPFAPKIQSPRTLCPKDSDAFSYKPRYVAQWFAPEDLYKRLPSDIQSTLFRFQHVGAAVLTGYERLEQHDRTRDSPKAAAIDDELEVQYDDAMLPPATLPSKLRTESSTSSKLDDMIDSPVLTSSQSSGSPVTSPSLSSSQTMSPVSPMCLTGDDCIPPPTKRSREHSFSTPQEPHNAYYHFELAQLRTESLPRLRHAARKVDVEWYDCKRQGLVSASDTLAFEQWWAGKKEAVRTLDERCKQLSIVDGVGTSSTGWTAP